MVKRAPSPTPLTDIKVLAVHYPYPPQANLELPGEQADFVSWLKSCLGDDQWLIAIGWKPKTPNVALVEILKEFPDWRRVLGEHKWSDVFLHLNPADMNRSSHVFYSTYSTHRQAEKAGWKFKMLDDTFIRSNTVRPICVHPYPLSSYCEPKDIDKTNRGPFRPLPVDEFPDAAREAPVVPGSNDWVNKAKGIPSRAKPKSQAGAASSTGAWGKGRHNVSGSVSPSVWGPKRGSEGSGSSGSASPARSAQPSPSPTLSRRRAWDESSVTTTLVGDSVDDLTPACSDDGFPTSADVDSTALSSLTDSFAETKLFDSTHRQDTADTTVIPPVSEEVEEVEDVWSSDPTGQNADEEYIKCPVHYRMCNPNLCADIKKHLKSMNIDIRDLRARGGGPSNIYTLERARKAAQEGQPDKFAGKGRRDPSRRGNRGGLYNNSDGWNLAGRKPKAW